MKSTFRVIVKYPVGFQGVLLCMMPFGFNRRHFALHSLTDISKPTSSFCALLVWQPVGCGKPNASTSNRSPPARYVLISSSGHKGSPISNTGRPHSGSAIEHEASPGYWPIKSTDREERAIKQLRSFIRQLSSHVSPIRVTQPTQPSRSGMFVSLT